MESRWFNTVVVLFWACTMSWLFVVKILPPLRKGEPPTFLSVLAAEQTEPAEVRWRILLDDRPIGFATHRVIRLRGGDSEIHSDVRLDHLPLKKMLPALLQSQVSQALGADAPLQLSWTSRLNIDLMGRLTGLRADVRVDGMRIVSLDGAVAGTKLDLNATLGADVGWTTSVRLPNDLVGNAVSPQSMMPGLRVGQEWTIPVFNPLRPDSAIEVLQATVPRDEWIIWNGDPIEARVVEIRADSGSTPEGQGSVRGRLWVAADGRVLKQEVQILSSLVAFERIAEEVHTEERQPPAETPAASATP